MSDTILFSNFREHLNQKTFGANHQNYLNTNLYSDVLLPLSPATCAVTFYAVTFCNSTAKTYQRPIAPVTTLTPADKRITAVTATAAAAVDASIAAKLSHLIISVKSKSLLFYYPVDSKIISVKCLWCQLFKNIWYYHKLQKLFYKSKFWSLSKWQINMCDHL